MNRPLWHPMRPVIWARRGRLPPGKVLDPVWYFAYGSNTNERLFRERRHMTRHEARVGRLRRFRLVSSVAGGMRPGVSAEVEDTAGNGLPATFGVPRSAPEGRPGRRYIELIREAARQRGLPPGYVAMLDRVGTRD